MASKTQKRKEQKRANRRKRLQKERNMRANGARMRYTLECRMGTGGDWRPVKRFRDRVEVQKHIDDTNAIRERGDTEIIEGRVLDNNHVFRVVATIPPFVPTESSVEEALEKVKAYKSENSQENGGNQQPSVRYKGASEQHEPQREIANAEISELEPCDSEPHGREAEPDSKASQ